jgi:hypothetical protein
VCRRAPLAFTADAVADATMARNFIRGSKFHLETAKRKFEGYFLAKHAFPELYHQRDPALAELRRVFDVV